MLTIRFEPGIFGTAPTLGPVPRFHLVGEELRLSPEGPPAAYHRDLEWCHADGYHIALRVDAPVRLRFEDDQSVTVGPVVGLRIADGQLLAGETPAVAHYDDTTGTWQVNDHARRFRVLTVESA